MPKVHPVPFSSPPFARHLLFYLVAKKSFFYNKNDEPNLSPSENLDKVHPGYSVDDDEV